MEWGYISGVPISCRNSSHHAAIAVRAFFNVVKGLEFEITFKDIEGIDMGRRNAMNLS